MFTVYLIIALRSVLLIDSDSASSESQPLDVVSFYC